MSLYYNGAKTILVGHTYLDRVDDVSIKKLTPTYQFIFRGGLFHDNPYTQYQSAKENSYL